MAEIGRQTNQLKKQKEEFAEKVKQQEESNRIQTNLLEDERADLKAK